MRVIVQVVVIANKRTGRMDEKDSFKYQLSSRFLRNTRAFDGWMHEVCVFERDLTHSETESLHTYLRNKWLSRKCKNDDCEYRADWDPSTEFCCAGCENGNHDSCDKAVFKNYFEEIIPLPKSPVAPPPARNREQEAQN
jgi:hypothetical protein